MRFTPLEVNQGKRLGLDTSWVKTKDDLSAELIRWIHLAEEHCPEVVDKLETAIVEHQLRVKRSTD